MWYLQMYLSGLIGAFLLLLVIASYDEKKQVPFMMMLIMSVFWPIAYPFMIALSFTKYNRPSNGK